MGGAWAGNDFLLVDSCELGSFAVWANAEEGCKGNWPHRSLGYKGLVIKGWLVIWLATPTHPQSHPAHRPGPPSPSPELLARLAEVVALDLIGCPLGGCAHEPFVCVLLT